MGLTGIPDALQDVSNCAYMVKFPSARLEGGDRLKVTTAGGRHGSRRTREGWHGERTFAKSLDDGTCYLLKEVDGARKQVKTDTDVCEQHEGFGSPRVQLREAKGYLYFPPIEK